MEANALGLELRPAHMHENRRQHGEADDLAEQREFDGVKSSAEYFNDDIGQRKQYGGH